MTKRNNSLQQIAQEMREDLAVKETGWVLHPLPRGLKVLLSRIDGRWRLALARELDFPSDVEVQICMQAFGVPEGVEPVKTKKPVRTSLQTQPIDHGVVELKWREL